MVPFRPRRRLTYVLGAAAAAAAAVALGIGLWANSVSNDLDRERSVLAILADPTARSVPLEGADGRIVVTNSGDAALVVSGLEQAPEGKTYEAWVFEGGTPRPAGTFEADDGRDVLKLSRPVPPGSDVAVTIEADGGVEAPTSDPIMSAST